MKTQVWFTTLALTLSTAPFTLIANAIQFIPLGPGNIAWDVSGDGSTVVGELVEQYQGFRWTIASGFEVLPGMGSALAVSGNGSVITGYVNPFATVAAIWTEELGAQPLNLPANVFNSVPRGISADGSVVVGYVGVKPGLYAAFRWSADTGMETLCVSSSNLGLYISSANAISDDGKTIVGINDGDAFKWTREAGLQIISSGWGYLLDAWGVSADGSVVVGWDGAYAYRWTQATGKHSLGDLLGGAGYSSAWDVTPDGNTIVGASASNIGGGAFIWDEAHGMRSLMDIVTASGVDLTGWQLVSANGISDNGMVIIGDGLNPNGGHEAWVIIIPEPSTSCLLVVGSILMRRRWGGTR